MDQLRLFIRSRNLACRTEKTCCHWVVVHRVGAALEAFVIQGKALDQIFAQADGAHPVADGLDHIELVVIHPSFYMP